MRSYFNGGESSTPPASAAYGMGGRRSTAGSSHSSASLLPTATPRSSASLPRSPDNPGGINNGGGSMMHGSNQEVYVNIYQNTNHPSLFVSRF